ncbi:ribbon-helix-helix domain-containing protein [Aquiflexum lacus]|uniref:ribbon-helix-helix domain-containing protein n=1 Tax=Aquiflexum lacus TaxID=2483805 RepID=UPI0018947229|nr:ribbon-helix-helix domain-containing protein [Aquiflexum lacus]
MATFTTSLPDELLAKLAEQAKKLAMPKNKLIENALNLYLEHLKRSAYVKSYKTAEQDEDILMMADEGMADYLKQIEGEAG